MSRSRHGLTCRNTAVQLRTSTDVWLQPMTDTWMNLSLASCASSQTSRHLLLKNITDGKCNKVKLIKPITSICTTWQLSCYSTLKLQKCSWLIDKYSAIPYPCLHHRHCPCHAPLQVHSTLVINSLQSGQLWGQVDWVRPWQPLRVEVVLHRLHPGLMVAAAVSSSPRKARMSKSVQRLCCHSCRQCAQIRIDVAPW